MVVVRGGGCHVVVIVPGGGCHVMVVVVVKKKLPVYNIPTYTPYVVPQLISVVQGH